MFINFPIIEEIGKHMVLCSTVAIIAPPRNVHVKLYEGFSRIRISKRLGLLAIVLERLCTTLSMSLPSHIATFLGIFAEAGSRGNLSPKVAGIVVDTSIKDERPHLLPGHLSIVLAVDWEVKLEKCLR